MFGWRPFALIQSGKNEMRPFLCFRFRVSEKVNATVNVVGIRRARDRKRIEDFLEPAEINRAGKFNRQRAAPISGELLEGGAPRFPFSSRANFHWLGNENRERRL